MRRLSASLTTISILATMAACTLDKTVHVTGVSFDRTSVTIREGEYVTLIPIITPDNADNKRVDLSSSCEEVAAFDYWGNVFGIKAGTATVTATTLDGGLEATCEITVVPWVAKIKLHSPFLALMEGQERSLTATVTPDNAADKTLKWTSSDEGVATVDQTGKLTAVSKGKATVKATANDGSGVFATCSVSVKERYTAMAGEAVDLGLSVKWSSLNLGAATPTGYGDHFAWGETTPKEDYSWSTYELCNGYGSKMMKYCDHSLHGTVDYKTELKDYDYEDDAARQVLGGNWCIPTDAEWLELKTRCTWTWVTNYNGSRVNGELVTATNGNSIFLPAAGFRNDADKCEVNTYGAYWSSSIYKGDATDYSDYAWCVNFYSSAAFRDHLHYRYRGFSVRPVSKE